jgi:hypothetical protein
VEFLTLQQEKKLRALSAHVMPLEFHLSSLPMSLDSYLASAKSGKALFAVEPNCSMPLPNQLYLA